MKKPLSALTVQQLQTFCGVYEHGGYAGAEVALGLTGPTMWEQIKTMESIYDAKLFERIGRNIKPTKAGIILYSMATNLLATIDSTVEILAEGTRQANKHIRVVAGARMMLEELGEPLKLFRQEYPDVRLGLMTADNRTAQEFVLDGKADLALLIEPPQDMMNQGITCQRLYPIDYLAALPSRHRLNRKAELKLSDLMMEPLIVGNPDTIGRRMLEQACFRLGIKTPLQLVAETDNSAVTIACVRAGLGIGIIAGRPNGLLTKQITTRSLADEIGQVNVVAAFRAGRQMTQVLQTLTRFLGHLGETHSIVDSER